MKHLVALGLVAGLCGVALADQPRALPPKQVCSLNGKVCATREAGHVQVWRKGKGGRRQDLWRVSTGETNLRVADDGSALVAFYAGANLVDEGTPEDAVMIRFFAPERAPVEIRLNQLIATPAALPRTVSHRRWLESYGFDTDGRFVVNTVEGRAYRFDAGSGTASSGEHLRN